MKNRSEKVYLTILLTSQIILFCIMILFAVHITNKIAEQSQGTLKKQALKITEEHMRERVENMISYIERERNKTYEEVVSLGNTITDNLISIDETMLNQSIEFWTPRIIKMKHGKEISIITYNKDNNDIILFRNGEEHDITSETNILEVKDSINGCAYHKEITYDKMELFVFMSQEDMDRISKASIYDLIHTSQYGEEGYVWVNEVINFDGGEDYAIRLIHPNLKNSEGMYLSTDMQDAAGNYPYLSELEGIKEKGEIFHTYYFESKSDGVVREKASYAKLYKPFQWIIATGDPLNEVYFYSISINSDTRDYLSKVLLNTMVLLFLIFMVDIMIMIFNSRRYKEKMELEERLAQNEKILIKADYDIMTGLLRRDSGISQIKSYIENTPSPTGVLIALDLDDLKGINDTLGHKAGDEAIIGISTTLKNHFRQSDILIRIGGDEFIAFLPNVINVTEGMEGINRSMELLLNKLSSIPIGPNKERTIHCSAGCATLLTDDTFEALYERADKALYHIKRNGKNNFAFYIPEMELENFKFLNKKFFSDMTSHGFNNEDVNCFVKSIGSFYNVVLSVNISNDTYCLMEEVNYSIFLNLPPNGYYSTLYNLALEYVYSSEKNNFIKRFEKQGLLKAASCGEQSTKYFFRFLYGDSYRWVECINIFYKKHTGDVCSFILLRWAKDYCELEVYND